MDSGTKRFILPKVADLYLWSPLSYGTRETPDIPKRLAEFLLGGNRPDSLTPFRLASARPLFRFA